MSTPPRENGVISSQSQIPEFGNSMKEEFILAPNFVHLNHGSYGKSPKVVQEALRHFQERAESQPDIWFRLRVEKELEKAKEELGTLLNVRGNDIVFIQNTTSGMNAILRSVKFQPGDLILHFNTTYNAMQCIVQYVCHQSGGAVQPLVFEVKYPVTSSDLVDNLHSFLQEKDEQCDGGKVRIRLALIDHISSTPGVVLPIGQIIPMLRARDPSTLILIDGAHAVGQVPIDLEEIDPDFYITNCHKWMYAARSCALMYVKKQFQQFVHPTSISYNYKENTAFQDEFFWTGTMDYSSYLTVSAALEFRRRVGGEAQIRQHNHDLIVKGGEHLRKMFGTIILQTGEEQIGSMIDIQLPIQNPDDPMLADYAFWLNLVLDKYRVGAFPHKFGGKWWIRVSAQIYNTMDEFEALADAFLKICKEINGKSQLQ